MFMKRTNWLGSWISIDPVGCLCTIALLLDPVVFRVVPRSTPSIVKRVSRVSLAFDQTRQRDETCETINLINQNIELTTETSYTLVTKSDCILPRCISINRHDSRHTLFPLNTVDQVQSLYNRAIHTRSYTNIHLNRLSTSLQLDETRISSAQSSSSSTLHPST
jgi:hypothetical protein